MLPPHGSKSMIHILQGFSLADVRMTSMFADRKRLFVDLMRWSVPVVDDHFEIYKFDNAEAVYLIAIDRKSVVLGNSVCVRVELGCGRVIKQKKQRNSHN